MVTPPSSPTIGRAAISTEDQAPSVQRFREMIGRDEKMLIVFEWIRTAAKSDISVLILGPTGSRSGSPATRATTDICAGANCRYICAYGKYAAGASGVVVLDLPVGAGVPAADVPSGLARVDQVA